MSLLDLPKLRADRAQWLAAHDDPPTINLTDEELTAIRYRLLTHHFPNLLAAYTTVAADLSAAQTALAAVEQVALRLADKAERALQLRDAAEHGHMLSVADFQRGQAVANEHASIALREILNAAPVVGRANDALGDRG